MSDQLISPEILSFLQGREEVIEAFAEKLPTDPDLTPEEREGFAELLIVTRLAEELRLCHVCAAGADEYPHHCAEQLRYWALHMIVVKAEEKAMSAGRI
jgi:hypothetical protein